MKGKSHALIVALVSALLGVAMIYSADSKSTGTTLFFMALYWFACGFVFHLIDSGTHKIFRTILYAVFLNLPWYIEEAVGHHDANLFTRLIFESAIMGVIVGFVSMKLPKKVVAK